MQNDMTSIRVSRRLLPISRLPACMAVAAFVLIGASTGRALAHEGHDHGDEAPLPATSMDTGPRATSQTEDFELVAAMNGDTLTLYLDDVDTNEPVRGAKVEIDSGAVKATASMQAPGVYTATAPLLAKPGRHPVMVSVETDDKADLMNVSLEIPAAAGLQTDGQAPPAHGPHRGLATSPWSWALGVAAALAIAVVLGLRARARSATSKAAS